MRHAQGSIAGLMIALVAGCAAQAPAQRLDATPSPITAVRVFVADAPDTAFAGDGGTVFSQTLQRNGLRVADVVVLPRAFADTAALERAWRTAPTGHTAATHALVLTRQRVETTGTAHYVLYEAVLWSAATQRLVWKSTVASLTNANGQAARPHRRVERLAGDAVRGLARDGFIAPPSGVPRDAAGDEIPPTSLPPRQFLFLEPPCAESPSPAASPCSRRAS